MKGFFAAILHALACALVAVSILLALLTASLLSSQVAVALKVAPLALAVTHLLPGSLAFWGVLSSPLGGVFRTDFMVVALAAFILSKIVKKIARALS